MHVQRMVQSLWKVSDDPPGNFPEGSSIMNSVSMYFMLITNQLLRSVNYIYGVSFGDTYFLFCFVFSYNLTE